MLTGKSYSALLKIFFPTVVIHPWHRVNSWDIYSYSCSWQSQPSCQLVLHGLQECVMHWAVARLSSNNSSKANSLFKASGRCLLSSRDKASNALTRELCQHTFHQMTQASCQNLIDVNELLLGSFGFGCCPKCQVNSMIVYIWCDHKPVIKAWGLLSSYGTWVQPGKSYSSVVRQCEVML